MGQEGRLTFEATENNNFQVTYQPERVSVRLSLEPDAKAFRLIRPKKRETATEPIGA